MRWFASTILALALALLAMASTVRANSKRPVDPRLRLVGYPTVATSPVLIYRYDAPENPPICLAPNRSAAVPVDFCNYDGFRRQFTAKLRDHESGLNLDYL